MSDHRRPGPRPKRLYVRLVRFPEAGAEMPGRRPIRVFLESLERVGRLVAQGELTDPVGDLLIVRASGGAEALRVVRGDPFRELPNATYTLFEWNPTTFGSGVNLEPPPPLGSGRLTLLQRVAVVVRDRTAALRWYSDVLGLASRAEDPETGYVELALGRGTAALSLVAPKPEWGEPLYSETRGRIGKQTGIVFQTDSVDALELRLRHAGANVTQSARLQPWGGRTVQFTDPDGNEFLAFQSGPIPAARRAPDPGPRSDRANGI